MSKSGFKERQVKTSPHFSSTQNPKAGIDPEATDKQTPCWQFHRCDDDHKWWGWEKLSAEKRWTVIKHLCEYEKITWAELKKQCGGRKQGTNHHSLPTANFVSEARKRLQQLKLDDIDELFSLRLNSTVRLYGIRDGRVLRFIWYDPHHGNTKEAYPTQK